MKLNVCFTSATLAIAMLGTAFAYPNALSDKESVFSYSDVFELEWAEDPQLSPDGNHIVYRRSGFDVQRDRRRGQLWLIDVATGAQHKLTSSELNESSPRWAPSGDRIAFLRDPDDESKGREVYLHWISSGQQARLSRLPGSPTDLSWSPDGQHLSFAMRIEEPAPVLAKRPAMPPGAQWSEAPRVTNRLYHERDGSGYLPAGFSQVFVLPAEGGSARQISSGPYNHNDPAWAADGLSILASGNRNADWEYDFRNTELYRFDLEDGSVRPLTKTAGPDTAPAASPDGRHIAWLGYDDKAQTYQIRELRIAHSDGTGKRALSGDLDRSVTAFQWAADSTGVYVQYDNEGRTRIAHLSLSGKRTDVADNLGGTSIGRPYAGGSFSVAKTGRIAYTQTRPEHPADVAIVDQGTTRKLTRLNADLLDQRVLGKTTMRWWKSRADGRDIQGWILTPPDFNPDNQHPLLVENHGGPISNYGERFSPELQLYAAAGYVVFFPNPRGSTGYGEEYGNLLYHNYPGEDYDDIMSGVDALLAEGFIDKDRLYVTGGSAGGIMSAWMIGKSDRFRAAAVVKPVMNWASKTLTADNWFRYYNSRLPGTPWSNPDDYRRFSPISLVGNVNTPTLVMVGLSDLRTPPSEAKQLYHALKYRKVPTTLVELPGASHFIAKRPSQLIDKINHILAWFERYP